MRGDLRERLAAWEEAGRLIRVEAPLAPEEEMARRMGAAGDRPIRFDRVEGFAAPVAAGICASRVALAEAVGAAPRELARRVATAIDRPRAWRTVSDAPCLAAHLDRPDLGTAIPLVRFYPEGGRRYATGTLVMARGPAGVNLSFHRMMLLEGNRLAVRVVPRHLHAILADGGGRAEVAVVCGVHPAVELAASISGPPELQELEVASALLPEPLEVVDLDGFPVPAEAELVLRGRFTGEMADEGPFVDLTGTYDGIRRQPVLEIDRMYHRPGWIYRTILPGGAEHRVLMGVPQEPRMLRIVSNTVASVAAVVLTPGGASWLHAVVAIRKRAEGDGRNAGLAALAAHPSLKRVVVVDDDIDPDDPLDVEWALATRLRPDRDLIVIPEARGSSLDPSRDPTTETGAKWILDATMPWDRPRTDFQRVKPGEGFGRG